MCCTKFVIAPFKAFSSASKLLEQWSNTQGLNFCQWWDDDEVWECTFLVFMTLNTHVCMY